MRSKRRFFNASLLRLQVAMCSFVIASLANVGFLASRSVAQPQQAVKVWEFSPYEVVVWYAFEPTINASKFARQELVSQWQADLQRTFRAAWNVRLNPLPPDLTTNVVRNFEGFDVGSLTANELVLVASITHESARTIRTFDAALETALPIHCTPAVFENLTQSCQRLNLPTDSASGSLLAKCVADETSASLREKFEADLLPIALISKSILPELSRWVRPLATPLPWQTDDLFKELDKLFFVSIGMHGDEFTWQVRELDCPMQFLGPVFDARCTAWSYLPRLLTSTTVKAFAPVARVEDADARTADLRLRAGGLLVDPSNPAGLVIGDVLQPIVRRDDRNGIPALLEPLPWTFAAITASDGVKMAANVYTYSGGPGLQGRKNRRTQRVLLKVRPKYEHSDIRLAVRGEGSPQSGCFVYQRDLVTDDFTLLGRTDWRGQFRLPLPQQNSDFLPDAVRTQRLMEKKKAEELAVLAEQNGAASEVPLDSASEPQFDPPASPASVATAAVPDQLDPDKILLRAALTQIYIKNGDTVLAKLPMVIGLQQVETAELPDDRRRLKAEAFVRGFQGEILDLIGLRNLLATRIKLHLKNDKLPAAEAVLEELRQLRNYTEMTVELDAIQRRMLDEKSGPVSLSSKNRIDKMFQSTRVMLQKYLQDNLLTDSERAVEVAKQNS